MEKLILSLREFRRSVWSKTLANTGGVQNCAADSVAYDSASLRYGSNLLIDN